MVEYTPGQWLVHEWGDGCTIVEAQVRVTSAPGLRMQGQKVLAQKLTRANAEFIVRACNSHDELLRALEVCLEFVQQCESCAGTGKLQDTDIDACRDCGGVGEVVQIGPELGNIRDAIAKARGQP